MKPLAEVSACIGGWMVYTPYGDVAESQFGRFETYHEAEYFADHINACAERWRANTAALESEAE